MATNNFLVFDENKSNIMSDADYTADSQRLGGVSGIAKSVLHNKIYHQASIMAAAIGEFIKSAGNTASDEDLAALTTAIADSFASKAEIAAVSLFEKAGGTGTVITLSNVTLSDGMSKTFIVAANNDGAATTINGKPLYNHGTTMAPKLIAGNIVTIWYATTDDCFYMRTYDADSVDNLHFTTANTVPTELPENTICFVYE